MNPPLILVSHLLCPYVQPLSANVNETPAPSEFTEQGDR